MAINAVNISSFSQIKNNNNNNNLTNINNKSLPILSCTNNSYESVEYQNNSLGSSMNNSPAGIGGLGLSSLSINCSKVNTPRDFKGKMKDILFSSFSLDYFQLHFSFLSSSHFAFFPHLLSSLFSKPISSNLSSPLLLPPSYFSPLFPSPVSFLLSFLPYSPPFFLSFFHSFFHSFFLSFILSFFHSFFLSFFLFLSSLSSLSTPLLSFSFLQVKCMPSLHSTL